MTTQEQPKEYIITEEQLNAFHRSYIPMLGIMPSEEYEHRQKVMQAIRSRPHQPAAPKLMNNQPEGTTCVDCQRFRDPSCPYPGSNITMTMCNAFKIDLQKHDATIRNKTLDEVKEIVNTYYEGVSKLRCIAFCQMAKDIESLRHQSTNSEATDR